MIDTLQVTCEDGAVTGARYAGRSGPALVFVHGVGSTAAIWDAQLDGFSGSFRCIAVELRGNGAVPDPNPASIARAGYALDVLTVTRALDVDRFALIGCSLGGVVAFELWGRARDRFDAMGLIGSFARYPNAQATADGIAATVRTAGSMRAFAEVRAEKLGLPPARYAETVEQMACKSVESYVAATYATWTGDYLGILPSIGVPALVACGEHDTVAPEALSREIAGGIPGSRFDIVPNAGHVANADNPAAFNALLRSFLASYQA